MKHVNGLSAILPYPLEPFRFTGIEKVDGKPEDLTEIYRDTIIEQAERGLIILQFMPVYCCGIFPYCRAFNGHCFPWGSIMAKWCLAHHKESFLYTHFEELCEIMKQYDVSFFFR